MLNSFLALMLVVVSVYSTPIKINKRAGKDFASLLGFRVFLRGDFTELDVLTLVSCPMILANITLASGGTEALQYCTNW